MMTQAVEFCRELTLRPRKSKSYIQSMQELGIQTTSLGNSTHDWAVEETRSTVDLVLKLGIG